MEASRADVKELRLVAGEDDAHGTSYPSLAGLLKTVRLDFVLCASGQSSFFLQVQL